MTFAVYPPQENKVLEDLVVSWCPSLGLFPTDRERFERQCDGILVGIKLNPDGADDATVQERRQYVKEVRLAIQPCEPRSSGPLTHASLPCAAVA